MGCAGLYLGGVDTGRLRVASLARYPSWRVRYMMVGGSVMLIERVVVVAIYL